MYKYIIKFYLFFKTIPDRLYPFSAEVEGRFVRGTAAYTKAVEDAWKLYGPHHLGYKLTVYRGAFHFVGSVMFVVGAALLSHELLGSDKAFYVLIGAAVIALFAQEFYFHPKYYKQPTIKGVTDWLTWMLPIAAYLIFYQ